MSLIKIKVDNEVAKITADTTEDITSGDIRTVDVEFDFSKEWDGYKKTAVFYTGAYEKEKAVRILMNGNMVHGEELPASLFEKYSYLSIGVFGDDSEGHRLTSSIVTKRIDKGTPTDVTDEDANIDLYNQIIRELIILERTSEEIDEKIESGTLLLNDTLNSLLGQIESAKNNTFDAITAHVTGHMDNLNSVTNVNLGHINSLADGRMQNIESSGNAAVTNINDALARAMTEMDREATNLINKIVASANDQIASISNTVNGHIGNINSIADAGISNINNVTNVNLTKITNIGEEKLIQIRQEADEIAETVKGKAFHVGLEITSADTVKRLEKNKLYFILAGGIKNIKVYNKDGEIAFSTQATHVIAMTGTKNENGIVTAALLYFDPEQNAFVSDYVTAGMDEYPEARVEISYSSGSVEVIIGNTV